MSIDQWPVSERPRERLREHGLDTLSDAELVALVLRSGTKGVSAVELARGVIAQSGDLLSLSRAGPAEIERTDGIGPAGSAALIAAFELGRRAGGRPFDSGTAFHTSRDVWEHFRGRVAGLRKEVFWTLLLDARHRKIREVRVSEGSLTASLVHPREVFVTAVRESAAALLLAHNHPSGDPSPSTEDVELTRRLRAAGELVGVRVLDHVIVAADGWYSFVDAGVW